MEHHLIVKGSTLDGEEVRRWIERPLGRLRRRLVRFPVDAVHLRTLVRETEGKPQAGAALILRLPSRTLSVSEEGSDARTTLFEAFEELERLLEKEKARLRRSSSWRRASRDFQRELLERLAERAQCSLPTGERDAVVRQLGEVERFVAREVQWLEASGELVPGEIDPRDVVDTAVARALARPGLPEGGRLLRSAAAALEAELQRVRAAQSELRIEEPVPLGAPGEARADDLFELQPPDAALRVEDVVRGLAPTPEELELTAERSAAFREALAALPARWRQAFELRHLEGVDQDAVAHALGLAPDELALVLENARAFLRSRIAERWGAAS